MRRNHSGLSFTRHRDRMATGGSAVLGSRLFTIFVLTCFGAEVSDGLLQRFGGVQNASSSAQFFDNSTNSSKDCTVCPSYTTMVSPCMEFEDSVCKCHNGHAYYDKHKETCIHCGCNPHHRVYLCAYFRHIYCSNTTLTARTMRTARNQRKTSHDKHSAAPAVSRSLLLSTSNPMTSAMQPRAFTTEQSEHGVSSTANSLPTSRWTRHQRMSSGFLNSVAQPTELTPKSILEVTEPPTARMLTERMTTRISHKRRDKDRKAVTSGSDNNLLIAILVVMAVAVALVGIFNPL